MKRMLFVLALGMPGAVWAGLPMQQETPALSAAPSHRPRLFEVKLVLRSAPKQDDGLPRIQFDHQTAAIVPVSLDRQAYRRLGLSGPGPNVYVCQSWACESSGQR